eukprot:1850880-Alexandrium_andersonii.AAC.1
MQSSSCAICCSQRVAWASGRARCVLSRSQGTSAILQRKRPQNLLTRLLWGATERRRRAPTFSA